MPYTLPYAAPRCRPPQRDVAPLGESGQGIKRHRLAVVWGSCPDPTHGRRRPRWQYERGPAHVSVTPVRKARQRRSSKLAPRPFVAPRDPGHQDQMLARPKLMDDAPGTALDPDSDAPQIPGAGQLDGAGWTRLIGQREDHAANAHEVHPADAVEHSCRCRRQDDPPGGHRDQPVSYSMRPSATNR